MRDERVRVDPPLQSSPLHHASDWHHTAHEHEAAERWRKAEGACDVKALASLRHEDSMSKRIVASAFNVADVHPSSEIQYTDLGE